MSMDFAAGIKWYESGSLPFAGIQALGICLEDGVQAIYHRCKSHLPAEFEKKSGVIRHIWVRLFFLWASPVWAEVVLHRQGGREGPFTMFLACNGVAAILYDS